MRCVAMRPSSATAIEVTRTADTHYRHADHAGNFADLFKHALLITLLAELRRDDERLVYLESHAGAGRHAVTETRVRRLRDLARNADRNVPRPLLRIAGALARADERWRYPGSPWLAAEQLGSKDRLCLVEREPGPLERLRALFDADPRVTCISGDGFHEIPDRLPDAGTRGLLLVDPPYVEQDEPDAVARLLQKVHSRWPVGSLAAWYPRRDDDCASRLARLMTQSADVLSIDCWLEIAPRHGVGMHGCGVWLVNPPPGFASAWRPVGQWLAERLGRNGIGRCGIDPGG